MSVISWGITGAEGNNEGVGDGIMCSLSVHSESLITMALKPQTVSTERRETVSLIYPTGFQHKLARAQSLQSWNRP